MPTPPSSSAAGSSARVQLHWRAELKDENRAKLRPGHQKSFVSADQTRLNPEAHFSILICKN